MTKFQMSLNIQDKIVIRKLQPDDIPVVATFEREIASISFADDPVVDLEFYKKKLSLAIQDNKNYLIVLDLFGKIIGWAWLSTRINFVTQEKYADLKSLYVDKRFRGSFCAFILMRTCLDYCQRMGFRRVVGRTLFENEHMKGIYEAFSFKPKHLTFELLLDQSERKSRS